MNQSKAISVIFALVLLFAGQAAGQAPPPEDAAEDAAKFAACFAPCFIGCELITEDIPVCAVVCLLKCALFPDSGLPPVETYCKLGCSINECAKLGHDANKVAECVSRCEGRKCSRARGKSSPPAGIS